MHPFEVPLAEYIQPDWISSLPEERWHGWRREFFISETQFAWKAALVWLSEVRPGIGRDRRRTMQWVAYSCKWSWANSDQTKARKALSHLGGVYMDYIVTELAVRAKVGPRKSGGYLVGPNSSYVTFLYNNKDALIANRVDFEPFMDYFSGASTRGDFVESAAALMWIFGERESLWTLALEVFAIT